MKLVTYVPRTPSAAQQVGAVVEGDTAIVPLREAVETLTGSAGPSFGSMLALIRAGRPALSMARRAVEFVLSASTPVLRPSIESVDLVPPLPDPVMLRCCSVFIGHARNCQATLANWRTGQVPAQIPIAEAFLRIPGYYKGNALNLVGPGATIEFPPWARRLDFELELAAIIGRSGRDVLREDFQDYIFGYSIFNDASARHPQLEEMALGTGPNKSKDFDSGNVLGPCIVTADEFDPHAAQGIVRVNGEEWGRGDARDMAHGWGDIIRYRSQSERLFPGEIITSGCFTNCSGIEHDRFLQPGDVIELEVPGIGILCNRVSQAAS